MKRFGYTLAEALIALTVIGVVAAIMLPMANKFMPDVNKAMFLKSYDSIVATTQILASNPELYPFVGGNIVYKNYPLANTSTVIFAGVRYENAPKYCQLLAMSLGADSSTCSENAAPPNVWENNQTSFIAKNGVEFIVYTTNTQVANTINYRSDIYIDTDGVSKGVNCSYDFNTCKFPDRFQFSVSADGKVFAADAKGQRYLQERANLRLNRDEEELNLEPIEPNNFIENIEIADPPTDPTEPSTEPTEPSTDSTEPSTDPTEPTDPSIYPPENPPTGPTINPNLPDVIDPDDDGILDRDPVGKFRVKCTSCGMVYIILNTMCKCPNCGAPILCSQDEPQPVN